jgi:UPF0271 protein
MALVVDLNCDIGESFGPYQVGNDEAVLEVVTSASIACGFHAGDPGTMRRTVRLARARQVAIGAHPGLPDRVAFGRRSWDLSPQEAYEMVVYQIGALWGFVRAEGGKLQHVKPHGALYNMAAQQAPLAAAIAQAVHQVDPQLILFAPPGSELASAGQSLGLRVAREAFADRTYEPDGTLTPRTLKSAMITDADQVVRQVLDIVRSGTVTTRQGARSLPADTICIHGDHPDAANFARRIRDAFEQAGVQLRALSS